MNRLLVVGTDDADRFPDRTTASWLVRGLHDPPSCLVERCHGERIVAAVRSVIARNTLGARKPAVVLFGDTPRVRRVAWAIVKAGLRPQIFLVLQLRAGGIPFSPNTADVLKLADLIVVESSFGARAVRACFREACVEVVPRLAIIPPAPCYTLADRAQERRIEDASEASFRVGCVLEPYSERRAFHALRIFRLFADGLYSVCRECGFVTPDDERSEAFEAVATASCLRCGSGRGLRGRAFPATLRVLALPASRAPREHQEPWDLEALRNFLGLGERVLVEGEARLPALATEAAWLAELSSFDAHLSPYAGADVDRGALMTSTLGVPTLTTRYGASSEVLAGHATLIEPRTLLLDRAGHWTPVMDPGAAALELAELAGKPLARARPREAVVYGDGGSPAYVEPVLREWRQQLARLGERPS